MDPFLPWANCVFSICSFPRQATREQYWNRLLSRIRGNYNLITEISGYGTDQFLIHDDEARELAAALKNNRCVEGLYLSICVLGPRSARALAGYIRSSTSLKRLFLMGVESDNVPRTKQVMETLLLAAGDCTSLAEVYVQSSAFLGSAAAEEETTTTATTKRHNRDAAFCRMLQKTASIKSLAVSELTCGVSADQAADFGRAMQQNSTLETLSLIKTGPGSSPLFDHMLKGSLGHCSLKKLEITNYWSPSLRALFESKSGIEELYLRLVVLPLGGVLRDIVNDLIQSRFAKKLTIYSDQRGVGRPLQQLFQRSSTLKIVKLIRFKSGELAETIQGLYRNSSVKALFLDRCQILDQGDAESIRNLIRRNRSLETLTVWGRGLATAPRPQASSIVARSWHARSVLSELNLGYFGLGDQGVAALCTCLGQNNTTLKRLGLSHNRIKVTGLRAVAGLLETDCTIEHLNLIGNRINLMDDGTCVPVGDILGTALVKNSTLLELELKMCGIKAKDSICIIASLCENQTLERLDLFMNVHLTEEAMKLLGQILPGIHALKHLCISWPCNQTPGDTSWERVLAGFQDNYSLETVTKPTRGSVDPVLDFYLARNLLLPFIERKQPGEDLSLGVWPHVLQHFGCNEDYLPTVQASLVQFVLCRLPGLVGLERSAKRQRAR